MPKIILDSLDLQSSFKLRDSLCVELIPAIKSKRQVIFLCIGTDRSTGDSLGPLIGHKLKFINRKGVSIYGNLESPVHAKNLCETIKEINITYNNPYIVAIDACLGSIHNVGKIVLDQRPIYPGSAVNKNLPPIGDLSITGIVNICGAMEFMVLQNTRLYTVMQLAETISQGIYHCILKTFGGKKSLDSNLDDILSKSSQLSSH
ncbi:spore protease YyaC [Clostridium sp.]|uniref:spore protease YyaC n=1 Tax=Clostridium sp. TaxID=1506 RepID=UPI003464830D